MKTTPPVKPMATTINLVQNGHSKSPFAISSVVRSISTYRLQITQVMAKKEEKYCCWPFLQLVRPSTYLSHETLHCKVSSDAPLDSCPAFPHCNWKQQLEKERERETYRCLFRCVYHLRDQSCTFVSGFVLLCIWNSYLHSSQVFAWELLIQRCRHFWWTNLQKKTRRINHSSFSTTVQHQQ